MRELAPWIERRLSEAREVLACVAEPGETVPYLGNPLALDQIVGAYATRTENHPKHRGSSTVAPSQQTLFGDTYV